MAGEQPEEQPKQELSDDAMEYVERDLDEAIQRCSGILRTVAARNIPKPFVQMLLDGLRGLRNARQEFDYFTTMRRREKAERMKDIRNAKTEE